MIYPRSIRDVAVMLVNAIAYPIGKAIDRIDFSNLTEDE